MDNQNQNNNQVQPQVEQQPQSQQPVIEERKQIYNNEETVIGKIEEEKPGNPLVVFSLIALIIAFVFFLPQINTFLGNKINWGNETGAPKVSTNPNNKKDEDTKHSFKETQLEINIDNLKFINFIRNKNNNYEISFTIINESDDPYFFNKKYYVVFYKDEDVVYRSLIYSFKNMAAKSTMEMTLKISKKAYEQANYFDIKEITSAQYPQAVFKTKEDDYDVLTCQNSTREIKYYFQSRLLEKITEKITYKSNLNNYANLLNNYRNISNKYNNINGINSTLIETQNDLTIINNFDLKTVQDNILLDLETYEYFRYHEEANVISFEMNSLGYTCS